MMQGDMHKVNAEHLKRSAYLYIRQSTPRQVLENTESTKRQYALRQRALALGWHADRIVVIDSDLGHSAAVAADREGFQRLVSEVGLGRAGLVIGLEVSRLARNSSDWHRLLEICALTETLILDEEGLYDPTHFNDRLLLGLKGAMSEAELHVMQARMRGTVWASGCRSWYQDARGKNTTLWPGFTFVFRRLLLLIPTVLGEPSWAKFPNLKRLVDEISARPAAQRALVQGTELQQVQALDSLRAERVPGAPTL